MTAKKKTGEAKGNAPAPAAEDARNTGDAPYGDSERGDARARPGTTPGKP